MGARLTVRVPPAFQVRVAARGFLPTPVRGSVAAARHPRVVGWLGWCSGWEGGWEVAVGGKVGLRAPKSQRRLTLPPFHRALARRTGIGGRLVIHIVLDGNPEVVSSVLPSFNWVARNDGALGVLLVGLGPRAGPQALHPVARESLPAALVVRMPLALRAQMSQALPSVLLSTPVPSGLLVRPRMEL